MDNNDKKVSLGDLCNSGETIDKQGQTLHEIVPRSVNKSKALLDGYRDSREGEFESFDHDDSSNQINSTLTGGIDSNNNALECSDSEKGYVIDKFKNSPPNKAIAFSSNISDFSTLESSGGSSKTISRRSRDAESDTNDESSDVNDGYTDSRKSCSSISDSDITGTSDKEDGTDCCSGNELNVDTDCGSIDQIHNSNISRQDKPVFTRLRLRKSIQQKKLKEQQELNLNIDMRSSNLLEGGIDSVETTFSINNKIDLLTSKNKTTQYKTAQCSESSSIFDGSILFLKNYFLPSKTKSLDKFNSLDKSVDSSCTKSVTKFPIHDKQFTDKEAKMPMDSNQYQTFQCLEEGTSRRPSTKSRLKDQSRNYGGSNTTYSKLNHPHFRPNKQKSSTLFQEFKRLLLLLILIGVCCVLLWQVYDILIGEYNYLGVIETDSELGQYKKFALSTDAKPCAKVGGALLAKGGSAVDAAIGTLLCMGVVIPNSLGLGGGCLMTIYDRKKKEAVVIDGREVAPDYAHENMFAKDPLQASRGPLSVGVPGELAAYWKAHQMYGKLNWSELFDGSIDLAENGSPLVEHLAYALRAWSHARYITAPLAEIFTNKQTGQYYDEGEVLKQSKLAETLRRIQKSGATEFYGGLTGQLFVNDLKQQGGNISLENLIKYEALVKKPLVFDLHEDLKLFTQPTPGSGIVLSIILRIMKELGYYKNIKPQTSFDSASLYYHRLVEAYKFAYAQRAGLEDNPDDPKRMDTLMAKLLSDEFIKEAASKINNQTHSSDYYGNVDYFREDHGTAHVSVLDAEGNAAAITSSVNLYFGSGLVSPSTGIVYNDVMDDFVSPNITNKFNLAPSKFNRIRPGKRPLSSMAPSVFTDAEGNVRLIIGGSGGSKITTAIASVAIRHCFLDENLKISIDGPRLHHQFLPNKILYEPNFPKEILHSLNLRAHELRPILDRSSVIMAIASNQADNSTRYITANSDYRKGGSVDGV